MHAGPNVQATMIDQDAETPEAMETDMDSAEPSKYDVAVGRADKLLALLWECVFSTGSLATDIRCLTSRV